MGAPDLGAAAAQAGLSGRKDAAHPRFPGTALVVFLGGARRLAMRVTPTPTPRGERRGRADCGVRTPNRSRDQAERGDHASQREAGAA